jgi:hypothetical protein
LSDVEDFRPQGSPAGESKPGHEPNTLIVRGLAMFAAALVVVGISVELVLAVVMGNFYGQEKRLEALEPPRFDDVSIAFPAPRLQADPAVELARTKQEDNNRLHGYGWIDQRARIAHIPIDRAIEILVNKGLPVTPAPDANTTVGTPPASKHASEPKKDARPESRRDQQQ